MTSIKHFSLMAFAFLAIASTNANEYRYREVAGKTTSESIVSVERDKATGEAMIQYGNALKNENHIIRLDGTGASLSWRYEKPNGAICNFTREGNSILIDNGSAKTKATIDGSPWLASIDWGLAEFSKGTGQTMLFWTVNPDNGKPYKMKAKRMKEATIDAGGTPVSAIRMQITADGVPATFFSMNYWYRKSDGVFIRFEGSQGGPGSPKLTIELLSEELR